MAVTGTIAYQSGIAAGAKADAAALTHMLSVLRAVGAAGGGGAGGKGGTEASIAAKLAADLERIKAKSAGNLATVDAKGAQQRVAIAAKSGAQEKAIAASAAAQQAALNAKDIAQKNAAMARLVQIQAKGSADIATAAAKGEQQRLAIAAKAAADIEKAAAKEAADTEKSEEKRVKIAAKAAADIIKAKKKEADERKKLAREAEEAEEKAAATQRAAARTGVKGEFIGKAEDMFGGPQLAVASRVLGVYEAIAGKMASLVEKGAELAIQAASFRDAMTGAFQGMGKSAAASDALYEKAMTLAVATGRDPNLIAAEFKKLTAAKFKDSQLPAIAKMLADVSDVKGEGKANQLEKLLEKTQAKGSLDNRVVSALVNQGVSQKELYEQLAKVLHKPVADIPGLIKTGKIDAATAIDAISKVVERGVGGVADKIANTIPALVMRIKIALSTLFDKVDVTPVKAALQQILKLITGPEGKALKQNITDLFSNLFALIGGVATKGGVIKGVFNTVSGAIRTVADVIKAITPGALGLVDGLKEGWKSVSPAISAALTPLRGVLSMLGQGGKSGDTWKTVGKVIGALAAIFITVGAATVTFVGTVIGGGILLLKGIFAVVGGIIGAAYSIAVTVIKIGSSIKKAITDAITIVILSVGKMRAAGGNLIGGLTSGIVAGMSKAVAAAGKVAAAVIARVKSILGIRSPSTVFADIGANTVGGFTNAVNGNAGKASAAAANMAKGAANAARGAVGGFGPSGTAGGGRSPGSGGGMVLNIAPGAIVIHGAGDGKAAGKAAIDELSSYVRRMGAAA